MKINLDRGGEGGKLEIPDKCSLKQRKKTEPFLPLKISASSNAGSVEILGSRYKTKAEVSAVPAPRFLLPRHNAWFPRNPGSQARKSGCSVVGMTTRRVSA